MEDFVSLLESKTLPIVAAPENKEEAAKIWGKAFNFAVSDPEAFSASYPLLIEYSKQEKTFYDVNEGFGEYISKFDEDKNEEEIISFVKPLILMFPFMNSASIIEFLKKVSSFVQKQDKIPSKLLLLLEKIEYTLIPASLLEEVHDFLRKTATEESTGLILASSSIISEICECVDNGGDFYVQLIVRILRGGVKEQIIASLALLRDLRNYLSYEDTKIPGDLFTLLLPLFISEDADIFRASHKAMNKLLECGVFNDHLKVKELIKQYSKYKTEERLVYFFKFLEKLLEVTENVTIPVAQPIYNFLGLVCKRTPPMTRALCLEAYSLLAAAKKDVFEEVYEQELEIAKELLETNDVFILSKVSCFISTLSNAMPETFTRILNEFIPKLTDFLATEETDREKERKYRLDIAQTLSEAIVGGLYKDVAAKIIEYIYKALDDPKGGEIYYIGSVIISLRQQLTEEQCTKLFQKVAKYMNNAEAQEDVNISVQMMKKLMSKKRVESKLVQEVINDIMTGKTKVLHGLTPNRSCDSKSMLMLLLTSFIKNYTEDALPTIKTIIAWLKQTRVSLIPSLLEPLRIAIDLNLIDEETIKEVYATLITLISKITADRELSSVISCLIQIITKNPAICDGEELLRISTSALANAHEAEVDDDEVSEESALSSLANLILTVYSIKEIKTEVNKNLICNVLDEIDQASMNIFLPLIVSLLKQGDRFKPVYVQLCKPVVDVLFLKRDDLADLGIEQTIADAAKATVRGIFKKNKIIEKQVQKFYNTPRQKLNRFNALFK